MTEKPTKKTKDGQKLTWHQVITRDLNTINIDLKKAIILSQDRDLYNEMVVDRVMAKAVENYLPVDGDPEQAGLSQDRDYLRPAETQRRRRKDWLDLDDLQNTLPGETLLCVDTNAKGDHGATPQPILRESHWKMH